MLDSYTDEKPPQTVKIDDAREANVLFDQAVQIAEQAAQLLVVSRALGHLEEAARTLLSGTWTARCSATGSQPLEGDQVHVGERKLVLHHGGSRKHDGGVGGRFV